MRLLNSADGLDDFAVSDQFLAIAANSHRRNLQQFSERLIRGGSLPIQDVKNESRPIHCAAERRHNWVPTVKLLQKQVKLCGNFTEAKQACCGSLVCIARQRTKDEQDWENERLLFCCLSPREWGSSTSTMTIGCWLVRRLYFHSRGGPFGKGRAT